MDINDLVSRWTTAERAGSADDLADLLADDFRGIGPVGFMLDRTRWLARFDEPYEVTELDISDVESADVGDGVTLMTGLQTQTASYRGHPSNGSFRVSMVLLRSGDRLQVVRLQLSGPTPPAFAGGG